MIGKSCGSTIIMLAITVVLIGIVLTISQTATVQKPNVETFDTLAHTKKELTELNDMYRRIGCQRKVEFVNHPDSTLSVAERAFREQSNFTCPTNLNVRIPSKDYYEVEEALMKYDIKSKCYSIAVTKLWQKTNSQVIITFPVTSLQLLKEILYLNPIFFEFNKSSAYVPEYNNLRIHFRENTPANETVTMVFNAITNSGSMKYSFNNSPVEGATTQDMTSPSTLSCTVYYLDLQDSSSEKIVIPYNGNTSQRVRTHVVFDKNYVVSVAKEKEKGYYFHQKIDSLLTNKIAPVITVKFAFNLTKGKPGFHPTWVYHEIFKMYMDTDFGRFNGLPYWEQNQYRMLSNNDTPLNNMFSFWLMSTEWNNNNNLFEMYVSLPIQWTGQNLWIHHHLMKLWIPYCKSDESISVIATLTTTDVIVNVRWKDPVTGKESSLLQRRQICDGFNLYNAIFTNAYNNYDGAKNNILLRYDNNFVTDVSSVMLGWRDYNTI